MLDGMEDEIDLYDEFQTRYRNDFAGFARDCIDWRDQDGFTDYQYEAARQLVTSRRFFYAWPPRTW